MSGHYGSPSGRKDGSHGMRIPLRWKIVSAFLFLTLLALLAGVLSYTQMNRMEVATVDIVFNAIPVSSAVRDLMAQIISQETGMRGYVITGDESLLETYHFNKRAIRQNLEFIERHAASYPTMKALVDEATPLLAEMEHYAEELIALAAQGPEGRLQAQGRIAEGKALMDRFTVLYAQMLGNNNHLVLNAWEGVTEAKRMAHLVIVAMGLSIGTISLLLGIMMARAISRPVSRIADTAGRVAGGDLSVDPITEYTKDEVGDMTRSFNRMITHLRRLVQDVATASQSVLSSLQKLMAIAEEARAAGQQADEAMARVVRDAEDQAQASAEMRDTMGQLHVAVEEIATGAQQVADEVKDAVALLGDMAAALERAVTDTDEAAEYAKEAAETADRGAQVVDEAMKGMNRILESVVHSAELIQELEGFSTRIGDITRVISDIAEQTNLLALNAAIEAARAGAHGTGFAVVADEVRKLAERSAASSDEITELVKTIQVRTAEAAAAMEVGTEEAKAGNELAAETAEALQRIVETANRAAEHMQRIAMSARDVSSNTVQVVRAFDSVATLTEESTAATEQVAAGAAQVTATVERVAGLAEANAQAAAQVLETARKWTASSRDIAGYAESLSEVAHRLQEHVNRFTVGERRGGDEV